MGAFASMFNSEQNSAVDFLDQSAFDEKFEIELDKDYISNLYHIENKYLTDYKHSGWDENFSDYWKKNIRIYLNDNDKRTGYI